MVVDRDLNVKPIPKFLLSLQAVENQGGIGALTLTTKVDGALIVQVPPARYRITSVKPLNFEGKQYSWDTANSSDSS
jgi:hypothetical protein